MRTDSEYPHGFDMRIRRTRGHGVREALFGKASRTSARSESERDRLGGAVERPEKTVPEPDSKQEVLFQHPVRLIL
jgi:hypothetical protein